MQKPEQEEIQKELMAGLYIIATPIGNLRDISLRALDALRACDFILCEDTRVTRKLLEAYGVKKPTGIYNDHSDELKRRGIIEELKEGKVIALVSDAGSPLVSDPGYKLVREARKEGIYITTVPGACAPVAAMQLSGLPSDKFSFLGFLPPKSQGRKNLLQDWAKVPSTLLVFETAPRLLAALQDIRAVMKNRHVAVIREITKLYEEVQSGDVEQLIEYYKESGPPKGEIVLVIAPPEKEGYSDDEIKEMLRIEMKSGSLKDAVSAVVDMTGASKKLVYNLALNLTNSEGR